MLGKHKPRATTTTKKNQQDAQRWKLRPVVRTYLVQSQHLGQLWPQIHILMTIPSQPGPRPPLRAAGCGWWGEGGSGCRITGFLTALTLNCGPYWPYLMQTCSPSLSDPISIFLAGGEGGCSIDCSEGEGPRADSSPPGGAWGGGGCNRGIFLARFQTLLCREGGTPVSICPIFFS